MWLSQFTEDFATLSNKVIITITITPFSEPLDSNSFFLYDNGRLQLRGFKFYSVNLSGIAYITDPLSLIFTLFLCGNNGLHVWQYSTLAALPVVFM